MARRLIAARVLAAASLIVGLSVCRSVPTGAPFTPSTSGAAIVVAAGDIACPGQPCDEQRATADLVDSMRPDAVLALGDIQYVDGALADFESSFDPTWGRFLDETYPVPGNHEYHLPDAQGYFDYFGAAAYPEQGGWYSFDVGDWHLLAINSGSGTISAEQLAWVEADLAGDDHVCELAYWHHPKWSSGTVHGPDPEPALESLWQTLHTAGVDVVLNGHEHNYERFALLDPNGRPDPQGGIRQFVVGTGGRSSYPFGDPMPGSEKRITDVFGVLELTLQAEGYGWRFVGVPGTVLDQGSADCHA